MENTIDFTSAGPGINHYRAGVNRRLVNENSACHLTGCSWHEKNVQLGNDNETVELNGTFMELLTAVKILNGEEFDLSQNLNQFLKPIHSVITIIVIINNKNNMIISTFQSQTQSAPSPSSPAAATRMTPSLQAPSITSSPTASM